MVKYMAVPVAVAVAVSGGGAVAVAGLTKRFFNHIQKDFLINVWAYSQCFQILFDWLGNAQGTFAGCSTTFGA